MLRFHIPNMTCGGCAKTVTTALLSIDPQARIEIELPTREVRVESSVDERAFLSALGEAGYPDQRPILK
ncbi:heavy metal transport/detoxification protein [Lysobacteraceae bacterium NML93-0792]|nr:heavy metal transport/detoxification protein [Xanthomonadaceae bacterium NML93-0792]PBS15610.1 heavy metal transport/detoxification protein [Xanthomonadaceae bacterium NML93-0793]PBS18240.1 heavy metal transport/detoxification protein [Xanthomonadaceae bacterium NML93-0831]